MEGMDRAGEPGKSWGGEADNVCDVFSFYEVGGDVSQERKTGLGRGRGDSVAGEETRRERRSKASEGCSHSIGHLRSEGWPCAVMLPAWALRVSSSPSGTGAEETGGPKVWSCWDGKTGTREGRQRCQIISHLRQGGG